MNSELLWSVYGAISVLDSTKNKEYLSLAKRWQSWLDYTKNTAARVNTNFIYPFRSISDTDRCFTTGPDESVQ